MVNTVSMQPSDTNNRQIFAACLNHVAAAAWSEAVTALDDLWPSLTSAVLLQHALTIAETIPADFRRHNPRAALLITKLWCEVYPASPEWQQQLSLWCDEVAAFLVPADRAPVTLEVAGWLLDHRCFQEAALSLTKLLKEAEHSFIQLQCGLPLGRGWGWRTLAWV
jgi:hypothetical protein